MKIPAPPYLVFREEDLIGSSPPRLIRSRLDSFPQVLTEPGLSHIIFGGVISEVSSLSQGWRSKGREQYTKQQEEE